MPLWNSTVRRSRNFVVGTASNRLDVFGSATGDDFDETRSDVDLLVEFSYDVPGMSALRQYFGFKEDLETLLGRPVDLVSGAIDNPFFHAAVAETREYVYAA